jgi:hypothetical protein
MGFEMIQLQMYVQRLEMLRIQNLLLEISPKKSWGCSPNSDSVMSL